MKYLYFIYKNITRKKLRATLTILSIVVAFLLFGVLKSLALAFDRGATIDGQDRLVSQNKISITLPIPKNYADKVRQMDGVAVVASANWFGGYYQKPQNFIAEFPIDPDDYFAAYKGVISLPADQFAAWKRDRIGVVIGPKLAKDWGWKIGDRIPLISLWQQKNGSTSWEFVVRGIYEVNGPGYDKNVMFIQEKYFDEARAYAVGTISNMVIRVKDPKQSAQIAAKIDAMFENSEAETKTASEKEFISSFAKQLGDIGMMVTYILMIVFISLLLVVGNTMSQAFRERIPEFGILKTLGFSNSSVMYLILSESILLCLIGGLLGMFLAKVMVTGFAVVLGSRFPEMNLTSGIFVLGLVWILIFALIAAIVPAVQGLRLSVVNALRRN